MFLYLVHHAAAVEASVDATRPLSGIGRVQATAVAAKAAAHGAHPVVVWHSGKLRARETAEIFWRACNGLASFTAARGLGPDDDPRHIGDALAGESDDVMIVGHFPHLPGLLRLLVGGTDAPFPQHGIVALERCENAWAERWREAP
jgi:phosphohistidine phosphatase